MPGTTTLTAETAAGDLLTELRELLGRHDGAATLDEARALADEVTAVLRRARGRIARVARRAAPAPTPQPAQTPATATQPTVSAPDEAAPAAPERIQRAPVETATPRAVEQLPNPVAAVAPPNSTPARAERPAAAAPRRISTIEFVLTAVAITTSTLFDRATRRVARGVRALTSTVRRGRTLLTRSERDERDEQSQVCIVCGPGCISPVLGLHTACSGLRAGATVVSVR